MRFNHRKLSRCYNLGLVLPLEHETNKKTIDGPITYSNTSSIIIIFQTNIIDSRDGSLLFLIIIIPMDRRSKFYSLIIDCRVENIFGCLLDRQMPETLMFQTIIQLK